MIPKLLTMPELLAAHTVPPECVVQELLPVGGLSILVAQPKCGKSTFVRNLMRSVARGTAFLGRETHPVPILYFALEEPIEHVAHEFRLLGASIEDIRTRCGLIPKSKVHEVLASDIEDIHAGLAVVDPLFDALSVDDINSYAAMNDALKELLHVARETRCHIMVLHHTNKRDVSGGLSVLGSQATAGATDHNLFLTMRKDGTRLFASQARVGRAFELSKLIFDEKTHVLALVESVKESRQGMLVTNMLLALGEETLTTTEWCSRVRGRNTEKGEAIRLLEAKGDVLATAVGRHTCWRCVRGGEHD